MKQLKIKIPSIKRTTSLYLSRLISLYKSVNYIPTKTVRMMKQICKKLQILIFKFKSRIGKFMKMNKLEMDLSKANTWLYLTSMMVTMEMKTIYLFKIPIIFLKVAILINFKIN